jgi:hypothetical protein
VVDGDGHIVELMPVFLEYVRDNGHGGLLDGILNRHRRVFDDRPRVSGHPGALLNCH